VGGERARERLEAGRDDLHGCDVPFDGMRKAHRFVLLVGALLALGGACAHWQQPASAAPRALGTDAVRTVMTSRQGSDFRYFPHSVGTARCSIPFVFRTVRGTCSTRVVARPGNSGQVLVTFAERWPWREFHYARTPRRTLHHAWIFDLLPGGKVVFVRQTGDFPPNFAL
jgi:hypothetical protein